jgi:hypothetical protein
MNDADIPFPPFFAFSDEEVGSDGSEELAFDDDLPNWPGEPFEPVPPGENATVGGEGGIPMAQIASEVTDNMMSEGGMGWTYEWSGFMQAQGLPVETEAWIGRMEQMDQMREESAGDDNIVALGELMRNCPIGYTFTADDANVMGRSLGEISTVLLNHGYGVVMEGMYIQGTFMRYKVVGRNRRTKSFKTTTASNIPMWNLNVRHVAPPLGGNITTLLNKMLDLVDLEGGSDLNAFLLYDEIRFVRKALNVEVLIEEGDGDVEQARVDEFDSLLTLYGGRLRTAGFSEILTEGTNTWIEVDGSRYLVVVPGGHDNCVKECMRELLKKEFRDGGEKGREMVEGVEADILEEYVIKKMTTASRSVSARERRRTERQVRKEFEGKVRLGYSGDMVREVMRGWMKRGIYMRMPYQSDKRRRRGNGQEIRTEIREVGMRDKHLMKMLKDGPGEHKEWRELWVMRITMEGLLYKYRSVSKDTREGEEKKMDHKNYGANAFDIAEGSSVGHLLHAVGIYPAPCMKRYRRNAGWRKRLNAAIEGVTSDIMRKAKLCAMGREDIEHGMVTYEKLEKLVEYQKERQEKRLTKNLFFKGEVGGQMEERGRGRWIDEDLEYVERKKPLIIAYDLETVELTKQAFVEKRVDTSFYPELEDVDLAIYQPENVQIPYSVQWVPVNVSDEGRVMEEKEKLGVNLLKYSWLGNEEDEEGKELREGWFETADEKKRVKGEWIVLDKPEVLYGERELLGECVHDFIERVGKYAIEKNFESVHAYAHNGKGFDSFVVEAFNHKYTVSKRLKTGRGILSLTLDYPYREGEKDKVMKITLLDTMVFLGFGLAQICKDFKLPVVWGKLDFPITRLNWKNCYEEEVKKVTEPYAINDVMSLAYVIKQINRMVTFPEKEVTMEGMEDWNNVEMYMEACELRGDVGDEEENKCREIVSQMRSVNLKSNKPPILQFLTFMSVVKKMLNGYFEMRQLKKAESVDVSAIRYWIERAQMGGRTTAYARGYVSSVWPEMVQAYERGDKERLGQLAKTAREKGDCMVVLDVTSLYPFAMASCPMPNGELRAISPGECESAVRSVGCEKCEEMMTLCDKHNVGRSGGELRPFAILLVRGLKPTEEGRENLRHGCGRKSRKENGGDHGIQYTLETTKELEERIGEEVGDLQAYTNVDLYWMLKEGAFEVEEYVGGFIWETTSDYSPLVRGGFALRKDAKKAKNQCLQQTLKLFLNGMYGVHSQKAILTKEAIITLPERLRGRTHDNVELREFVAREHSKVFDVRFTITGIDSLPTGQSVIKAKLEKGTGEVLGGGHSPNQVGCAVLAWSRHIMNLVMYKYDERSCTYTDTDSLCVPEYVYQDMKKVGGERLVDESGKGLGSYKNDHGDHFAGGAAQHPRVYFSAIGTKKVKMHCVVDESGELKIANTYKGFMAQPICPLTGKKFTKEKILYEQSKSLMEIFYDGTPSDRVGTRWSRSTEMGVRIEKNVITSGESATYLAFCRAFTISKAYGGGIVFLSIPYGCQSVGKDGTTVGVIIPEVITDEKGKVVGHELGSVWKEVILPQVMGGLTLEDMDQFLQKYYRKMYEEFYLPSGMEEREEFARIHGVFDTFL